MENCVETKYKKIELWYMDKKFWFKPNLKLYNQSRFLRNSKNQEILLFNRSLSTNQVQYDKKSNEINFLKAESYHKQNH